MSEIDDRPNHIRLIPGVQAYSLQGRADIVVPIRVVRAKQAAVIPPGPRLPDAGVRG